MDVCIRTYARLGLTHAYTTTKQHTNTLTHTARPCFLRAAPAGASPMGRPGVLPSPLPSIPLLLACHPRLGTGSSSGGGGGRGTVGRAGLAGAVAADGGAGARGGGAVFAVPGRDADARGGVVSICVWGEKRERWTLHQHQLSNHNNRS